MQFVCGNTKGTKPGDPDLFGGGVGGWLPMGSDVVIF